jgi:hypothetical protein
MDGSNDGQVGAPTAVRAEAPTVATTSKGLAAPTARLEGAHMKVGSAGGCVCGGGA